MGYVRHWERDVYGEYQLFPLSVDGVSVVMTATGALLKLHFRVWPPIELEFRDKNQCVARDGTEPAVPDF